MPRQQLTVLPADALKHNTATHSNTHQDMFKNKHIGNYTITNAHQRATS